jgi:hypothetical protein
MATCSLPDGPSLRTKKHGGGLRVLEAANLEEAVAGRRKAAIACRASVEIGPFHSGV